MSKTVRISDDLAALVDARRRASGDVTIEATVESLIVRGLFLETEDHSAGRSDEALRSLIDEAENSGPAELWDAEAVRAEVLRRSTARRRA